MSWGLSQKTLALLLQALSEYPELKQVKIFGSRVKGNYADNSDIDLVVWGVESDLRASMIEIELNELDIPQKIELKRYESIVNVKLKDHIDRLSEPFRLE